MGNTQCARLLVSNSMKWVFLLFWLIWLNFDTARFLIFYLFISIILCSKMWKENDGTALHLLWKYSFVNKQCLFDYILPNVSVILQQMVHSFFLTTFIWCFFYHKRFSIRIHVLMTENSNFKQIQQQFHHKMLITFEFWHVLKSFTFSKHKKVNISLWTFPKGNSLFSVIVLTDKPFSCVYSLNISIQYQFFIEILIG